GLAIAGSINVVSYTNVAQSIINSGTQINQDPFYRPDPRFYLKPGDPGFDPLYAPDAPAPHGNDNITHSANANNVDEHVVSIEATNYMQVLNLTGVFGFQLPQVSIGVPGPAGTVDIASAVLKLRNKDFSDITEAFEKPSLGAKSEKGGVGGA